MPIKELKRSVCSDPKDEIIESISTENSTLKAQLLEVQKKLQEKEKEFSKLTEEVVTLKNEQMEYQRQLQFQEEYERTRFTYEHVIKRGQYFHMTGLTESEFDCLLECLEPFVTALVYPDCKSSERSKCRKMDKRTELVSCPVLTILYHAVHLGIIGWMMNAGVSTQSRLFVV